MADTLLATLPQVDKRVVVLSDLADGQPDAPPLGEGSPIAVWTPLDDMARAGEHATDCGILSADDVGARVRVRPACGKGASAAGRTIEIRADKRVLGSAPVGASMDVTVDVTADAAERTAYLSAGDAIASDDSSPVLIASSGAIGVVAETVDENSDTRGTPVVEQALDALRTELATRPLPAVPDQPSDFSGIVGLVIDDPPGFTPEQRRALGAYFDSGGVVLAALGGRAAAAPLGADARSAPRSCLDLEDARRKRERRREGRVDGFSRRSHAQHRGARRKKSNDDRADRSRVVRSARSMERRRAARREQNDRTRRSVHRDASVRARRRKRSSGEDPRSSRSSTRVRVERAHARIAAARGSRLDVDVAADERREPRSARQVPWIWCALEVV